MNIDIIGGKNGINTGFMNPWVDLASSYAPRTINSALELCEFLYVNDSTYRKASERIVNYFLTDLKFSGQSDDERKKFEKLITEDFDLAGSLQAIGNDFMCYGNSFATVSLPFTRVLVCSKCKRETNIEHVDFKYNPDDGSFITYCGKCTSDTKHIARDYKKKDSKAIKIIRWNPKHITICLLYTSPSPRDS